MLSVSVAQLWKSIAAKGASHYSLPRSRKAGVALHFNFVGCSNFLKYYNDQSHLFSCTNASPAAGPGERASRRSVARELAAC